MSEDTEVSKKLKAQQEDIARINARIDRNKTPAPETLAAKVVVKTAGQVFKSATGAIDKTTKTYQTVRYAFNFAGQVARKLEPLARPFWNLGKKLHYKYSYSTEADGTRRFSPKRSFFAATVLALGAYLTVTEVVPTVAEFTYDAVAINALGGQEVVYLQTPRMVRSNPLLYEVGGCDSYPCTAQNTFTYRIRDSVYLDTIEWAKLRNISFFPDQVANAIPAAGGKCTVDYWGLRWRWVRRNTNLFPYIHNISCEAITPNDTVHPLQDVPTLKKVVPTPH